MSQLLTTATLLASCALLCTANADDEVAPCDPLNEPWIYPAEATDINDPVSWARFAWDGFIALNWPQLEGGQPGEPDTSVTLCDDSDGRCAAAA